MERHRAESLSTEGEDYAILLKKFYRPIKAPCPLNRVKSLKEGVEIVNLWKSRGQLPHAVTVTATLVDAILEDSTSSYSQALTDFATGFTDTHQDKKRKQSMFEVSRKIGLPDEFVSIRNSIVHGDKPSTAKLRQYTLRALRWLWEEYWADIQTSSTHSKGPEDDTSSAPFDAQSVKDIVKRYQDRTVPPKIKRDRYHQPKTYTFPNVAARTTSWELIRACGDRVEPIEFLVNHLLQVGRMIPVTLLQTSSSNAAFQWWALIDHLSKHLHRLGPLLILKLARRLALSSIKKGLPDEHAVATKYWMHHMLNRDRPNAKVKDPIFPFKAVTSILVAYPGPFTTPLLLCIHMNRWCDCKEIFFGGVKSRAEKGFWEGNTKVEDKVAESGLEDVSELTKALLEAEAEEALVVKDLPKDGLKQWLFELPMRPKAIGVPTVTTEGK